MNYLLNAIIVAVAWVLITGEVSVFNSMLGFMLAYLALWLIRDRSKVRVGFFSRVIKMVLLFFTLIYEMLKSALSVSKIVLSPNLKIKPSFIAYELTVKSDIEITLLANLITLTPGTVSIDVSADKSVIFIHFINYEGSKDNQVKEIKKTFEAQIGEIYGNIG